MNPDEIVVAAIGALERSGVGYMVVGSLSVNLYAIPRSTQDADFVVDMSESALREIMRQLGPDFHLEPQARFETVTATTRHIINTSDRFFRVEIFQLSSDPHDRERFARRRRVKVLTRETYAPTCEDVIIMKLRWSRQGARSKDVDDVRNIIAVRSDKIDWDYVHQWCDDHGTRKILDDIRDSIPKLD